MHLSGLRVVPMYDIDLMWHAHMAHSGVYRSDIKAFTGGKVGKPWWSLPTTVSWMYILQRGGSLRRAVVHMHWLDQRLESTTCERI
jgi:hypothetical protein